mmetsp:Transcript_36640/g.90875  ORF Transcript_36640/g.90875 Transcript_36640/m.90875 type:complete len:540 (+) Transcript_36640:214-1833(+)
MVEGQGVSAATLRSAAGVVVPHAPELRGAVLPINTGSKFLPSVPLRSREDFTRYLQAAYTQLGPRAYWPLYLGPTAQRALENYEQKLDAHNKAVIVSAARDKRATAAAAALAAAGGGTADVGGGSGLVMLAEAGAAVIYALHVYPMPSVQTPTTKLVYYECSCDNSNSMDWDVWRDPIPTIRQLSQVLTRWHNDEEWGELKAGGNGYTLVLLRRVAPPAKGAKSAAVSAGVAAGGHGMLTRDEQLHGQWNPTPSSGNVQMLTVGVIVHAKGAKGKGAAAKHGGYGGKAAPGWGGTLGSTAVTPTGGFSRSLPGAIVIDTAYAAQILTALIAYWKAAYTSYSAEIVTKVCTWLKGDKRMADLFMQDPGLLFNHPFLMWPTETAGDISQHLAVKQTVAQATPSPSPQTPTAPPQQPTAPAMTPVARQSFYSPTEEQETNSLPIYSPLEAAAELASMNQLAELGLTEEGVDVLVPVRLGLDRWLAAQFLPSGAVLTSAGAVLQMGAKTALLAAGLDEQVSSLAAAIKACLGRYSSTVQSGQK